MATGKTYKAVHRHAQISARKVRAFADLVRGKYVKEALDILSCYPNRGARLLEKVINSAKANAADGSRGRADTLEILDVRVDSGPMAKRWRPKARGSSMIYLKRSSHISVEIG